MEDIEFLLNEKFLFRDVQIKNICQIFSPIINKEPVSTRVLLYGAPSLGKTAIAISFFEETNIPYSLIECVQCYTTKLLFTTILQKISGNSVINTTCDSALHFIITLDLILQKCNTSHQSYVLILKQCEYLSEDQLLLFSILHKLLNSSIQLNVLFITSVLHCDIHMIPATAKIYFPRYNNSMLKMLLNTKCKNVISPKFLDVFIPTFYYMLRDYSELKQLVSDILNCIIHTSLAFLNILVQIEFLLVQVVKPEIGNEKNAQGACLSKVVIPFSKYFTMPSFINVLRSSMSDCNADNTIHPVKFNVSCADENSIKTLTDIPYFSKLLLTAAYMIPFVQRGKTSSTMKCSSLEQNKLANVYFSSEHLHSSKFKYFPLPKLITIFVNYLVESSNDSTMTAMLFSQVSSLIDLRLMNLASTSTLNKPLLKYNFY